MVFFHFQRILETEILYFCVEQGVSFVCIALIHKSHLSRWPSQFEVGRKNKLLFNRKKSPASLSVVVCEKIGEAAGVDIHNTNTAANNL